MDCYSDFFSLLSLSQVNHAAASSSTPPEAGIAPSSLNNNRLESFSNGHRLGPTSSTFPPTAKKSSMSMATSYSHGGMGPVLVASQCVNDVEMMDGTCSSSNEAMATASLSTCRQVSGFKRRRGSSHHPQLALGDDADRMGSVNWAAMPAASTAEHDLLADADLQPEKQKVRHNLRVLCVLRLFSFCL